MTDIPEHIHKIAASHSEPLFLSEPFLGDGHGVEKANGTLTFIQYRGRIYGVTCAHVYYHQFSTGKWLALHGKDRYCYQLGQFTQSGHESLFRPLRDEKDNVGIDIAIIELGDSIKQIHFERKNKSALDLDDWVEPNWTEIKVPVAFGYPTEHKTKSEKYLQAPLVAVAAELTRTISASDKSFLLSSSLESDNKYFFSGMSGGAVYHVPDVEDCPTVIGIVFEGIPGSSIEWQSRDEESFLTRKDIQIRAYTITPYIFENWLRLARSV